MERPAGRAAVRRHRGGCGGWVLHDWSFLLAGLAMAGLVIFAARRFATELADVRAEEAGSIQPDTAFPPALPLVGRDDTVREVAAEARRRGVVVVHGPAGIGVSAVAI